MNARTKPVVRLLMVSVHVLMVGRGKYVICLAIEIHGVLIVLMRVTVRTELLAVDLPDDAIVHQAGQANLVILPAWKELLVSTVRQLVDVKMARLVLL